MDAEICVGLVSMGSRWVPLLIEKLLRGYLDSKQTKTAIESLMQK